jgi:tRNA dimethylallyltransferase
MHKEKKPPLVVILGPTAVGKTEISLALAERLKGEIISADSRLLYRGMDIGTAKPTAKERARIPHHLINVTEPDEVWSLALFQNEARKAIYEIYQRGRLPFLVGGTGQYVRAILEEWDLPKVEPQPEIRKALENWSKDIGPEGLYNRLASLDLQAASQIDYRNLRRTVRALEVIFITGRPFSEQRQKGRVLFNTLQLGLWRPRQELYARVDARIEAMIEAGLIEEVRALLEKGYSPKLPPFSAIGYKEIIDYLHEKMTLDEAISKIKRSTRIYVRRQANWFKASDRSIHWFQPGSQTIDEMEALISKWLH